MKKYLITISLGTLVLVGVILVVAGIMAAKWYFSPDFPYPKDHVGWIFGIGFGLIFIETGLTFLIKPHLTNKRDNL